MQTYLNDPDIDVDGGIGDACKGQDDDTKPSNSLEWIVGVLLYLA